MEALLIKKALARFNGNVSHAANALGPEPQRALPAAATIRVVRRRSLALCPHRSNPPRSATKAASCCWPCWRACRVRPARWSCCGPAATTARYEWTLTTVIVSAAGWVSLSALRERVVFPLQTLANLLGALREGDYSVRGRSPRPNDALGEVMREVNTLGSTLREQRLGAMEATTLLRTVMREIDVAIFAFDEHQPAAPGEPRRASGCWPRRPSGCWARRRQEMGLETCLDGPAQTTLQASFPGGAGRFGVRRTRIRERGLPLELVVISDLTQALSEQELQAWQRLVRVLGHELNNSLTPIKSIAGSLASILSREPLPDDWRDDMRRGLTVITSRSESLSRFIGAYARLAKLPRPQLQPLEVAAAVGRAVSFETRLAVEVEPGPDTDGAGRSRSAGAGADQPAAQRRRCLVDHRRRGADRLAPRRRHAGDLGEGRRPGPVEHGQPVRPVLHHQARRLGHRPGAEPADRRRPRRRADAGESHRRPWVRGAVAAAGVGAAQSGRAQSASPAAPPGSHTKPLAPVFLADPAKLNSAAASKRSFPIGVALKIRGRSFGHRAYSPRMHWGKARIPVGQHAGASSESGFADAE